MNWKKGDIAIYVRPGSPYYGTEVKVLSGLEISTGGYDHLTGYTNGGHMVYEITNLIGHPNGFCSAPEWLRPKDEGARDWFRESIKIEEKINA